MITETCMKLPVGSFTVSVYSEFKTWVSEAELQTKQWFVDHIQDDWNIIDAGANIGMYSILFSRLASNGKIYCFEPTDTVELLRMNLTRHHANNAEAIRQALGSEAGEREETIYKIWGSASGVEKKQFPFTTIDVFISERDFKTDLIKIDVDSYDYEVLLGAKETLLSQRPWVMVELNGALSLRGFHPEMAQKWMNELGYHVVNIFDGENYLFGY